MFLGNCKFCPEGEEELILAQNYSYKRVLTNQLLYDNCIPPVNVLGKNIPEPTVTSLRLRTPMDEIEIPLTINKLCYGICNCFLQYMQLQNPMTSATSRGLPLLIRAEKRSQLRGSKENCGP